MNLFSPLDLRYQKDLPDSLSEFANLQAQVEVEKTWLAMLSSKGICPNISKKDLDKTLGSIGFDEIEEIESRTQHATRALVEAISQRLSKKGFKQQAEWVHVGLTSFDTVDTAIRLRLKWFFEKDFFPQLKNFKKILLELSKKHAKTEQVGRTHGQWAVPTIFGLSFAEALIRIETLEARLCHSIADLRGQCSGAIGGYHAPSLLFKNPLEVEKEVLSSLGLKPHYGSTQILPPEDVIAVANDMYLLCSVIAKVANDLRHLARSEIAEVSESMGKGQVGSSTMPQKRNPWNLEHVCSLFKVLYSKHQLLLLDCVTEHQRDLTNSASGRFYTEFFAVGFLMMKRLSKVLSTLLVDKEKMQEHLNDAGFSVYAEALYVLATKKGHLHAHDIVREASREAEKTGRTLSEVLVKRKIFSSKELNQKDLQKTVLLGSQQKLKAIGEHLCVD